MRFSEIFEVGRGLTALIGGGGKTSLMYRLAEELQAQGSVIVCTSTHIRRPDGLPVLSGEDADKVRAALQASPVVCLGREAEQGKLCAPGLPFSALTALADFVLVEADGAKRLPLKAHLPHEPVIPENAAQTILVAGASGLGQPIRAVCHRPERWAALAGCEMDEPAAAEGLARVIRAEGYGDRVFLNQAETPERVAAAQLLAQRLPCPVYAGSIWREELQCWS